MSIEDKVARLQAARDAQAAALAKKGVEVPDGAGFEDFPSLTEAIAASGMPYDAGSFVLDADSSLETSVFHNLGKIPRMIVVWTDEFAGIQENPYTTYTNIGLVWLYGLTGMPQKLTSAATNTERPMFMYMSMASGSTVVIVGSPTSMTYVSSMPTEEKFYLNRQGATSYWRAGVEYKYFVSEGFW